MYIAYDIKNGVVYAKLCVSRRTGKTTAKDYINLGRVIDKKHGIYKNRERGVFTYSIEDNTYGKPDASVILPESLSARREKLILDFGDTFFLDAYVRKMGLGGVEHEQGTKGGSLPPAPHYVAGTPPSAGDTPATPPLPPRGFFCKGEMP